MITEPGKYIQLCFYKDGDQKTGQYTDNYFDDLHLGNYSEYHGENACRNCREVNKLSIPVVLRIIIRDKTNQ